MCRWSRIPLKKEPKFKMSTYFYSHVIWLQFGYRISTLVSKLTLEKTCKYSSSKIATVHTFTFGRSIVSPTYAWLMLQTKTLFLSKFCRGSREQRNSSIISERIPLNKMKVAGSAYYLSLYRLCELCGKRCVILIFGYSMT